MSRPVLLTPKPMTDAVIIGLKDRFDIIRLWEQPDGETVLVQRGREMRAVAVAGHACSDGGRSDGLRTTVFPIARAGLNFPDRHEQWVVQGSHLTAHPDRLTADHRLVAGQVASGSETARPARSSP